MDKSLEKYRGLYELTKNPEKKRDLFGETGLFGGKGSDHEVLKLFAEFVDKKQKENQGVLTFYAINKETFNNYLKGEDGNKELIDRINGLEVLKKETIQTNTFLQFAKVLDSLGIIEDDEGLTVKKYDSALENALLLEPRQNIQKKEPPIVKAPIGDEKKVAKKEIKPEKVKEINKNSDNSDISDESEEDSITINASGENSATIPSSNATPAVTTPAVNKAAPSTPTSGTIPSSNATPAVTTPAASVAANTAANAKPTTTANAAVSAVPETPAIDTATTTSTSATTSVNATIESEKTATVQQNTDQDAPVSAAPATPDSKKPEIPNLKATLDISGNSPKTLKIATMGSEEADIDNERIRNNVNTMGGLLSIPRAPTRSPGIQGIPLPSQNRKVHRLHGNRRMKAPAKKSDPLKIQDAKPVNRKTPETQAQQAQQAQLRGLEDQEYNDQLRRNVLGEQEAQQEEGGQSKSSKLKKALIGGGIGSAVAGGGFFSSIIIPDEETTAFGASFVVNHAATAFKSIISIIHLFLK